ncbi:glycosyltransferase family 2 protein [soil metagenome]
MNLSIVLPSYKSAALLSEQLPEFMTWLKSKPWTSEVIVVDDGSEDNGATEKAALENGCRFFQQEKNMGKGAAVRRGMLEAKGEFRIFTDADIPFEYSAIELFLRYVKEKEFDIAIGDRRLPGSKYFSEIKGARKMGSTIFTFFVGRFITTGFSDTQCGIKAFKGSVAEELFSVATLNGFAFDVEILYIALKKNYDIKRLPVHFRSTHDGSSVSLMKHAPGMLMDLFRIKLNHMRGRYMKK